jgi:hypothetical protein
MARLAAAGAAVGLFGAGASIIAALVSRQSRTHVAVTSVQKKMNSNEILLLQYALDPFYNGRTRKVDRGNFSPFTGIDDITFNTSHMIRATNPNGKARVREIEKSPIANMYRMLALLLLNTVCGL